MTVRPLSAPNNRANLRWELKNTAPDLEKPWGADRKTGSVVARHHLPDASFQESGATFEDLALARFLIIQAT